MWQRQHAGSDPAASEGGLPSGGRKNASSKRRWDQDTPAESSRKKSQQSESLSSSDDDSAALAGCTHNSEKVERCATGSDCTSASTPQSVKFSLGPRAAAGGGSVKSTDISKESCEGVPLASTMTGFPMGKSKVVTGTAAPIKMSLASQKPKGPTGFVKTQKKVTVAAAFNSDEDSEEEMPVEARMRMKNIGRNTPTSAGPNSYGKGRLGFCDRQKLGLKNLEDEEEES